MKLWIREYHDILDPRDVTRETLHSNVYEVDSGMIFNDPEIHNILHEMLYMIESKNWDWIQFHDQDRGILYHGTVITGEETDGSRT